MHTCPPPTEVLDEYLATNGTVEGNFGHLLIEQGKDIDQDLIDGLRPYFESAHLDAREFFHSQIGISLHPDAGTDIPAVSYPSSLPDKAQRGLFGEVMAGLVTEAYQSEFVGSHRWSVPIFLFRFHDDVEKYLWSLRWDPLREREIYGRHGTDFIAVALNRGGEVARLIAGECKWRATLTKSAVASLLLGKKERNEITGELEHNGKGIWYEFNRDSAIPHGLRQLQRLLEERDPDGHATVILSIDLAVFGQTAPPGRTNLLLIIGNGSSTRTDASCLIPWESMPQEYTAPHDLQVVEVIMKDGERLIEGLYSSLWGAP
jgi:hypothetical protein